VRSKWSVVGGVRSSRSSREPRVCEAACFDFLPRAVRSAPSHHLAGTLDAAAMSGEPPTTPLVSASSTGTEAPGSDGSDSSQRARTPSTPFDKLSLHSPSSTSRIFTVNGTTYCLPARYELIKTIGHGAYGVVISCVDQRTGVSVAVKKIGKAFDNLIDAKRVCREIKLLRHLEHENLMSIIDIIQPPAFDQFSDVCVRACVRA
jgi:hypothetical protein